MRMMLRQQQHQIHLLPITILLSVISIASAQQFNNNDGTFWRDAFRLGFSYDPLDLLGPARWSAVGSSNNNNQNNNNFLQSRDQNWGEWDYVGRLATMDNDDEDAPVLLNFQENECGSEAYPSPIELIPTSACTDEREMKTRQFNPFIDCMHPKDNDIRGDDEITQPWEITPYSLRYYYPRTDRVCRRPSLRLDQMWTSNGKNEEHFSLLWLELHARSEHVVNGQRYDAELQMVHMGTTRPNELVVVSVMIQADATQDHTDFQNYLLDGWQRKAARERYLCRDQRTLQRERAHLRRGGNQEGDGKDDKSEHDVYQQALYEYAQAMNTNNHQFDDPEPRRRLKEEECVPDKYGHGCEAQGLGPRKRTFPYSLWPSVWYYSYTGSLTAPPCAGQVHWRIIDTPLSISRRQYKQLTQLLTQSRDDNCRMDSAVTLEGENFRPLQNATLSTKNKRRELTNDKNDKNNKDDKNNKEEDVTDRQQDNKNNNNNNKDNGPQVVSHCTSEDFPVEVYDERDQ